jgi:protein arginine N-methyltransferase 7
MQLWWSCRRRSATAFAFARWDKDYAAWYLADLPHRVLTRPVKVFEYFFDGLRKGRGRENILGLEVMDAAPLHGGLADSFCNHHMS